MEFRRFTPPPALAPWVDSFWSLRSGPPAPGAAPERIVPDGCMELVVNLAAPVRSSIGGEALQLQPQAVLAGQITRVLLLEHLGPIEIVAARFRPGGASAFFGFDLSEWADAELALADLGEPWSHLEDRLQAAPTTSARMDLLRDALLRALRLGEVRPRPVERALQLIRAEGGLLPVERVARGASYSPRQLERVFQREIGLSPKQFSRIVRFQHLLRRLPARGPRWAEAAFDAGLTDQAHLVREFRAFTGLTPTAWIAERTPMGEALRE